MIEDNSLQKEFASLPGCHLTWVICEYKVLACKWWLLDALN